MAHKIWSTSNGSLLAEWKQSDDNPDVNYSCMTCSLIRKKRKKARGTCLLALSTDDGDILAVNVFTGEMKWKSSGCYPGGIAGLSFANKGHSLYVVGTNRMASEINSETGEIIREFKASKRPISSLAFSGDEKILAMASSKLQLLSLENGKEILKVSLDLGSVQYISVSDDAKAIVTSGFGEKGLQVWKCDLSAGTVSRGPVLSMRHPPLVFECKNGCNEEGSLVVLAVSESGIAYVWNLNTVMQDEVNPTKVTVKGNKDETDRRKGGSPKKSRTAIIAARIHALETDGRVTVLITYGSVDSPQFNFLDISNPGENIVITAADETVRTIPETVRENGVLGGEENFVTDRCNSEAEAAVPPIKNKKANKKRAASSDPDLASSRDLDDTGHGEALDGVLVNDDLNEPTMGEKLASLNLLDNDEVYEKQESPSQANAKPPSADSVHVLLKQALHADDRVLLLDCLYTQDEKVIANTTSLLNPSDVLKLLDTLISIIQSRGAVLACALPWLRSLLLQHASGIMSQESSLLALNSLYQLIDSRISTFQSALQLIKLSRLPLRWDY
ncbi:hypothetical protein L1049_003735 [Liquidambar formosana]|uniref:Small-subunit processome Utp12 domain-containing protein n=1 Tax=Liquidambar formosana TaxID=63359 RepID=A0AAP0RN49_LIQFO